jgi:hypothetical protein
MKRFDNWPTLLSAYIDARRSVPFAWGTNDCCLFAADWVLISTGHDIAQKWRGKYASAYKAHRFLKAGGGIEKLVERAGGERVAAGLAQRGDLVAQDFGTGVALGVCIGSVAAFVADDGIGFVPFPIASIWRF